MMVQVYDTLAKRYVWLRITELNAFTHRIAPVFLIQHQHKERPHR